MRPSLRVIALAVLLIGAGDENVDDLDLMSELETAVESDATTRAQQKGSDATQAENIAAEDPFNWLPEVIKGPIQTATEVVGNEVNPSLSFILDFAGTYFSAENRIHLGGHAPTTNGPSIQGAELAASASIDPYFRFDLAYGMWHGHVEEAYATTTALPWNLKARAGVYKANIGRHNPTHLHQWPFALHPLPNEWLFGAEGLSQPGFELSFLFPAPWYIELIAGVQSGESGSFRTKPLSAGDPTPADFNYPIRLVQFFDLADDLAMQLGLNAVTGTSPNAPEIGNRSLALGTDTFLKWRPIGWGETGYTFVSWTVEAWYRQMQVAGDLWEDIGGYSDLIYGMDKRWQLALRVELWKRLSGEATGTELARDGYGADTVRATLALSFSPSHFSRVRLQYTFENVEGYDYNNIVLLQLEVSAGAHGAHTY